MEINSLKALAFKVLQRNHSGNFRETDREIHGNSEGVKVSMGKSEKKAYRIFSNILNDHLWFVPDESSKFIPGSNPDETIYSMSEIRELLKIKDQEGLKQLHEVKKVFNESRIIEINHRENKEGL
jgi:hypothetical protein